MANLRFQESPTFAARHAGGVSARAWSWLLGGLGFRNEEKSETLQSAALEVMSAAGKGGAIEEPLCHMAACEDSQDESFEDAFSEWENALFPPTPVRVEVGKAAMAAAEIGREGEGEGEGEGQGEGEKGKIEGSETRREVERDGVKGGGEKFEIGREGEVGEGEKLLPAKRKAGDITEELSTPLRTKWPRRWIHPFPPMRLLDDLDCTEEEPMECNGSSVEDRLFCEMRKKSFLEAHLDALKNEMEMKADQMLQLEAEYDESVVHFERVRKSACARSEVEQLKREAAAVEEGNRAFVEGTWRAAQQTHAAAEGRLAEAMKVKGVVEEEARKLERVEAESNKALLKAIEEKNEIAVLLRERKELLDQIEKMEDGEEVMNDDIVNLTRKRSQLSDEVDHLEQVKAQLQNGAAAEEGAAGERTMGGLQANKRRKTTAS